MFSSIYSSIWPIDENLTSTSTPNQSGPGSHDNDGILYIPQSSKTEASPSDAVCCHTQESSFIWSIDETLRGTTTLDQSGPGSNGNEGLLHIPQSSKTEASPSDAVCCHTQETSFIWSIDETLRGTTTLDQSGPGSNGNEGLLHIPQSSKTEASPSDAVCCHTQETSFIWSIDETLRGTTTPDQSGPGSNVNEGVLHIPQSSKTEASPSDAISCHIQDTHREDLTSLQRCSPQQTGLLSWVIIIIITR